MRSISLWLLISGVHCGEVVLDRLVRWLSAGTLHACRHSLERWRAHLGYQLIICRGCDV